MVLSDTKIRLIQNLRNQGFTVREVAQELNVSNDSVIKYSSPASVAQHLTRVGREYSHKSGVQGKPITEKIQRYPEIENIKDLKQIL